MTHMWGFYQFLCMFKTVLSKTRRNNSEERVGVGERAIKRQPPPTEPSRRHCDSDRDPDSGRPAAPLTLFCFRALFSFMWGQSFPVTMALMSATGTGK